MPVSTPDSSPFDKRAQYQNRRITLLSEAARLFNTRGSGATTLKEVAAELELTKTSLYYYVKTKQDLIYQCYSETCDYDFQLLDQCESLDATGVKKVEKYIHDTLIRWADIQNGVHPHIAILDSNDALPDEMRADIATRYLNNFNTLIRLINVGLDDGSISPCNSTFLAIAINGAITWMPRWLSTLSAEEVEVATAQTCDIFLNGISNAGKDYQFQHLQFSIVEQGRPGSFDKNALQQRKLDAFLRAGTQMFNSQGYDHTSLDAIAEILGVTKGAFYYHIKSKPDLLRQCTEQTFDLLELLYQENNKVSGTGAQILERYCRHIFFIQNSEQGPLMRYNVMTRLPAEQWAAMQPRVEQIVTNLYRCLTDGNTDGSLRPVDSELFRRIVMGISLSCLNVSYWSEQAGTVSEQSRDYFNFLFKGFAAT